MRSTLLIAPIAAVPLSALLLVSVNIFMRRRTFASAVQLAGAGCLMLVVLVHVSEALQILPFMGWGEPNSVGHYLDLASAMLGLTLLPLGLLLGLMKNPDS